MDVDLFPMFFSKAYLPTYAFLPPELFTNEIFHIKSTILDDTIFIRCGYYCENCVLHLIFFFFATQSAAFRFNYLIFSMMLKTLDLLLSNA